MGDYAIAATGIAWKLGQTDATKIEVGWEWFAAAQWRAVHLLRVAGGARYWKRRRVPRWVRRVEACDSIMRAVREFDRATRQLDEAEEILNPPPVIITTDNAGAP